MNEQRTLAIRFSDIDADGRDFVDAWKALEVGNPVTTPEHALTFESLAGFLACLTEKRWTLLHTLRQIGPSSIQELADELQRHHKDVHGDIRQLRQLGLVADDDDRVYVPWDEIDARIALAA